MSYSWLIKNKYMKPLPLVLSFFAISMLSSCIADLGLNCLNPEGVVERRLVEMEAITKIDLELDADLFISEGPQQIEIEAAPNIIDLIMSRSNVGSEKWNVKIDDCYDGETIKIYAQLPQFVALDITGSGNIISTETLKNVDKLNLEIDGSGNIEVSTTDANKLDIQITGSGDINIESDHVDQVSTEMDGSGNINIKYNTGVSARSKLVGSGNITLIGNVEDQLIELDGSGNFFCKSLVSSNCTVDFKGSGNAEVNVVDRLNIDLSGSGNICYLGNPIINSNIDGSGNIRTCN